MYLYRQLSKSMSATEYKQRIKNLVDATDDESLLKQWNEQLEWDIKHQEEAKFTDEEWKLVEEGLQDYESGNVISFDEFISKRR